MEDELRNIHGEDGLEERDLKFDRDLTAEVNFEGESDLVQEAGAADQMSGQEEENSFTYEVCTPICELYCSVGCEFKLVIMTGHYSLCFTLGTYFWSSLLLLSILRYVQYYLNAGNPVLWVLS
jgi:hypothetical protein